jgi:alpha-amylase
VQVTFTEVGYVTSFGQNIYIVGNVPELGNWNTAQAVKLNWVNTNTWSGPVIFTTSKGQTIQYKYIVKNPNGSVIWEGGSNHSYTVPASGSGSRTDNWQP